MGRADKDLSGKQEMAIDASAPEIIDPDGSQSNLGAYVGPEVDSW